MEEEHLLAQTYGFYFLNALLIVLGLTLSIYLIFTVDNVYVQLLNAAFLAFIKRQIAILGHELTHNAVFKSKSLNTIFGVISWGSIGISEDYWLDYHNIHHKYPNVMGADPDARGFFKFSPKQLNEASPFVRRWITPFQHIIFWLFLPLVRNTYTLVSFRHIVTHLSFKTVLESVIILLSFAVMIYVTFTQLPLYTAIMFILVSNILTGIYFGLSFAPNHRGREIHSQKRGIPLDSTDYFDSKYHSILLDISFLWTTHLSYRAPLVLQSFTSPVFEGTYTRQEVLPRA